MTKNRAINYLVYNGEAKPDGITQARWAAMLAHLKRECVTVTETEVTYHTTT